MAGKINITRCDNKLLKIVCANTRINVEVLNIVDVKFKYWRERLFVRKIWKILTKRNFDTNDIFKKINK